MSPSVLVVAVWLLADMAVAPLVVVAAPARLARRVVATGGVTIRIVRSVARPVPAGGVQALSLGAVLLVTASVGPFSPGEPVAVVGVAAAALVAGSCVATVLFGPWPELRPTVPSRLALLVVLALEPVAPAALIAPDAEDAASLLLLGGSVPPVVVATVLVARWLRVGGPASAKPIVLSGRSELTAGEVQREFDRLGPSRHREPPAPGRSP